MLRETIPPSMELFLEGRSHVHFCTQGVRIPTKAVSKAVRSYHGSISTNCKAYFNKLCSMDFSLLASSNIPSSSAIAYIRIVSSRVSSSNLSLFSGKMRCKPVYMAWRRVMDPTIDMTRPEMSYPLGLSSLPVPATRGPVTLTATLDIVSILIKCNVRAGVVRRTSRYVSKCRGRGYNLETGHANQPRVGTPYDGKRVQRKGRGYHGIIFPISHRITRQRIQWRK